MNLKLDLNDHPHRRFNPLTRSWVLVSPHRGKRPWLGSSERPAERAPNAYDADCALCPGNARANGARNPNYEGVFSFDNDFAALLTDTPRVPAGDALFRVDSVRGESRVLCFSPDHSKTLPELSVREIEGVIDAWTSAVLDLASRYTWVQVFENKGEMMGCSQPHPHCQIWASSFLPEAVETRDRNLRAYFEDRGKNLLVEYVARELEADERIVFQTDSWVALVPFWAAWPFETMLLPKAHVPDLAALDADQRKDLAVALRRLTTRYDNLFECSFPYSMGWHFAPDLDGAAHWQLYALFLPPLLRSASVRKFMVGYEMLAEPQRDLTPEQAAARLRALSDTHYKEAP